MTTTQWVPRSKRGDAAATAEFLEFVPGLEGRRKDIAVDWLLKRGGVSASLYHDQPCDLAIRFLDAYNPHWEGRGDMEMSAEAWRRQFMAFDEVTVVDFLDYALHDIAVDGAYRGDATHLEKSLRNAHSVYMVGKREGRYCIEERIDPTVQAAVKETIEESGTAGQLLSRAWSKAYGRPGDASGAYSDAIKSVEMLACPMILPASPKATLGTAIKALDEQHNKSTKSTWEFTIENPSDPAESVNAVISAMKLLWHGQVDRHGSDASVFKDATIDQARAAVLLAAALVGWLNAANLVKK